MVKIKGQRKAPLMVTDDREQKKGNEEIRCEQLCILLSLLDVNSCG